VGLLSLHELAGLGTGTDLPSFYTPPAADLVLCSPPCETLRREVTQAKCDEWAEQAKTARCQEPVRNWRDWPCTRSVPPDCYGRTKVKSSYYRNCYEWECPPGQAGYTYAPGQHYTPSSRVDSAAAADELAALRARRRDLLAAAHAAAQASARPSAQPPRPTIAVGEPHPAAPPFMPPPPSTPRAPAFDTNNLIWLMAGAVIVMALRR
jgi:hypothetical protein